MIQIRRLIVLLIILFVTSPVFAQTIASLDNASQAYEQGDFENAIQFFELTIEGGIYNGEIFYNLGNAYYQQNDIAYALLNYRRALQSLPRDLDLNIQLARARSIRTIPQQDVAHPLILMEQMTENAVTVHELGLITLVIWVLLWTLIALYQLQREWRGTLKLAIGICLIFVLGLGALLGTRIYVYNNMSPAIVTVGSAPVYSGPSVSYFHQSDLFAASEIYVVEKQDEWRRFVTPDNQQGWIQAEAISLVPVN